MIPSEELSSRSQEVRGDYNAIVQKDGTATVYNIGAIYESSRLWSPPLMRPVRPHPFVGRKSEIEWLRGNLYPGRVLCICGPGGMGKTTLVAEFLWQLAPGSTPPEEFPDGIYFYSFYGQPQLDLAFEALARAFGVTGGEAVRPSPALAARRAVSARRALLVFDGVEQLASVRPLIELSAGNTMLLTSRRRSDAPSAQVRCDLDQLPREDAITLLQELAGSRAADQASVRDIYGHVGGFPLALRLIGCYLDQRQEDAVDYLRWLQHSGLEALDHGRSQYESIPLLLARSVDALSPQTQRIFFTLGLLALAPFHDRLIAALHRCSPDQAHGCLGELVNFGFLVRPAQEYCISHPLVRAYAEQRLASPRGFWQYQMIKALQELFDLIPDPYSASLVLWLPHVQNCLSYDALEPQEQLSMALLCTKAGILAFHRRLYGPAEPLYVRALSICEQWLGETHSHMAICLNNLAALYDHQDKYEQAEPLLKRALSICEQQLGEMHPKTATCLNTLALLYDHQDKYEQAEPLLKRALSIYEQQLGEMHPEMATCLNNLALLYYHQGRSTAAEPLYARALSIYEQQLGEMHPEMATCLKNLAGLYTRQGKYAAAKPLYVRALSICEQRLGETHPETLLVREKYASLLRVLGFDKRTYFANGSLYRFGKNLC